jgi:Glycosyl hydrolase family 62
MVTTANVYRGLAVALGLGVSTLSCAEKSAVSPRSLTQESGAAHPTRLRAPFRWRSTGPLIGPRPDPSHPIISLKDPSVVFFEGRWHLFATTANERGEWSMVYISFADWAEAAAAQPFHLGDLPVLRGYHCAPHVFFFAPQKKWYLIFQSGQPQYSTTDDISKPDSWSAPTDFFPAEPASIAASRREGGGWLDFWTICDDASCYLFFTNDNGSLFRSRTNLAAFPRGFDEPVVAMRSTKEELYEASATYRIDETRQYLTLVEAFGPDEQRFFRSFVSDSLDGAWRPLAATFDNPFAGERNVVFESGTPWTRDISHGELLRSGYDQTLGVSLANMRFLYQGVAPESSNVQYVRLPYRLGLLTRID